MKDRRKIARTAGKFILLLGGLLCAFQGPFWWKAWELDRELQTIAFPPRTLEMGRWMVVVGRRVERQGPQDTVPFRNSPLALYKRESVDHWVKVEGDLMSRSTSTCTEAPTAEDYSTIAKYIVQKKRSYEYGFSDVPVGVYELSPAAIDEDGASRYLIHDLNWSPSISLSRPQVIRSCIVERANEDVSWSLRLLDHQKATLDKTGTYLHATSTWVWSHRDSKGCINLYNGGRQDPSDWVKFKGWLKKHKSFDDAQVPVALLVEDFGRLSIPGEPGLAQRLKVTAPTADHPLIVSAVAASEVKETP